MRSYPRDLLPWLLSCLVFFGPPPKKSGFPSTQGVPFNPKSRDIAQADAYSFTSTISACGEGGQWRLALWLFDRCPGGPGEWAPAFHAALSACEKVPKGNLCCCGTEKKGTLPPISMESDRVLGTPVRLHVNWRVSKTCKHGLNLRSSGLMDPFSGTVEDSRKGGRPTLGFFFGKLAVTGNGRVFPLGFPQVVFSSGFPFKSPFWGVP